MFLNVFLLCSIYWDDFYVLMQNAMPASVLLTVAVRDKGGMTDTAILNVTITDANDRTPTFAKNTYHIDLYNNTQFNTVVLTVAATDDDYETATNGAFDYSVAGENLS